MKSRKKRHLARARSDPSLWYSSRGDPPIYSEPRGDPPEQIIQKLMFTISIVLRLLKLSTLSKIDYRVKISINTLKFNTIKFEKQDEWEKYALSKRKYFFIKGLKPFLINPEFAWIDRRYCIELKYR